MDDDTLTETQKVQFLLGVLRKIYFYSDSAMKDGDAAREDARAAILKVTGEDIDLE